MNKFNKRGVSELVSFTLLTLLVSITSISSYLYVSSSFEETLIQKDYMSMESFLKTLENDLPKISSYDQSSQIYFISFEKGALILDSNSISYQTLLDYESNSVCIENFCYQNIGGFERLNLSFDEFNFTSNFTLVPGTYTMQFIYQKNISGVIINLQ